MRIYLLIILFFLVVFYSIAQEALKITSGTVLSSSGAAYIIVTNAQFLNNGAFGCGTGTVSFKGNASSTNSLIGGTTASAFNNLTINKTANDIELSQNISVASSLTLTSQGIDLKNSNIDLGTTGVLNGETDANRIKVLPTGSANDGKISATRTLVSGLNSNIAGLRLDINSTSYTGSQTISRGHQRIQGAGSYSGNYSALLYYNIAGIGKLTGTNSITINYFSGEISGFTEANLQIFQRIQEAGNATPWLTPVTSIVAAPVISNTAAPYNQWVYDRVGNITFQDNVTLASTDTPLPINLISTNATCNGDKVNIKWETQSETNNNFFTLKKSTDAVHWLDIATIQGAGNSNSPRYYQFIDINVSKENYYLLTQTDFDGTQTQSDIFGTNCSKLTQDLISVYPSPFHDNFTIEINTNTNSEVTITLTGSLGNSIFTSDYFLVSGVNRIVIDGSNLSPAFYYLKIISKQENYCIKLFKN